MCYVCTQIECFFFSFFYFTESFKSNYTLYLNSGLTSTRNYYGEKVVTREAHLDTVHELAPNWGSEHDPDLPECSPQASQGWRRR